MNAPNSKPVPKLDPSPPYTVQRGSDGPPDIMGADGKTYVATVWYGDNAGKMAAAPELHIVAEAILLFHADWDKGTRHRWNALTGGMPPTTKGLCDMARAALEKAAR